MDGDDLWDAFDGGPHRVAMGLRRLDPAAWVDLPPAPALGAELARKEALLETHPDEVLALLPSHDDLAADLLATLLDNLAAHHPERFAITHEAVTLRDDGRSWRRADHAPLDLAGRIVSEDWCLVAGGALVGAHLCSPNRWRLAEKLGHSMGAVHDPVPGYHAAIGAPVERLLARPSQPVWRQNWSIHPSDTRFQPFTDGLDHPGIPDDLFVRSERETLMPLSHGWVFGIRTRIRPLADMPPAVAARAHTAVASLDPDTLAYKEMAPWRDQLLAWLATRTITPSGGTAEASVASG